MYANVIWRWVERIICTLTNHKPYISRTVASIRRPSLFIPYYYGGVYLLSGFMDSSPLVPPRTRLHSRYLIHTIGLPTQTEPF